jgi:hypothetical protein
MDRPHFVRHRFLSSLEILLSVVVRDFDVVSVALSPREAHAPLLVYANAKLAFAVAAQSLKAIARQPHRGKLGSDMKYREIIRNHLFLHTFSGLTKGAIPIVSKRWFAIRMRRNALRSLSPDGNRRHRPATHTARAPTGTAAPTGDVGVFQLGVVARHREIHAAV